MPEEVSVKTGMPQPGPFNPASNMVLRRITLKQ